MDDAPGNIQIFGSIAAAVADKHRAAVKILSLKHGGARPPFDELMAELKLLEKDLTGQAIHFIDQLPAAEPENREEMTAQLREIIRNTIEGFIKAL